MAKSFKFRKLNKRKVLIGLLIFILLFMSAAISGFLLNENKRLKTELSVSENKYANFINDHTTSDTSEFIETIDSSEIHSLVNVERKKAGLGELTYVPLLESSACLKAEHMIQNDYWAHVAPDGTQPWYFFQKAGVYYDRAGENLAYGFSSSSATVEGWMNSPTHKANILGDYSGEGICVRNAPVFQNHKQVVVVQHFYK